MGADTRRCAAGTMALAVALAACGGEGDRAGGGEWLGTVDTLPSGAIHVRNPDAGIWDSASGWRLIEELRIGSVDSDGPDMFGDARQIDVDDGGRIYVLDAQALEVRVFGPDGSHLRTIGRAGEGPGEFKAINGLRIMPDGQLLVVDHGLARYSVFDTTGQFRRSMRRQITGWGYVWDGGVDDQGELYEVWFIGDRSLEQRPLALFRLDSTGALRDTFPLPNYQSEFQRVEAPGGQGSSVFGVPFSPGQYRAFDPAGFTWIGVSDAYRLVRRSLAGDTVRIVEREAVAAPVSDEDRARVVDPMNERFEEMYGLPNAVDQSRIPDTRPLFDQFFLDDRDHLWVRVDASDDERNRVFDIFDPDGRYLGVVRSPIALSGYATPVVRGNSLYAIVRDSLDVPAVVRLRIEGRER